MEPPDRPPIVKRFSSADLRRAWTEHAAEFMEWARKLGHDSYWQFHRELFLPLIPSPGHRTLDPWLRGGEGLVGPQVQGPSRGGQRCVLDDACRCP
jgi:hypothetical protein